MNIKQKRRDKTLTRYEKIMLSVLAILAISSIVVSVLCWKDFQAINVELESVKTENAILRSIIESASPLPSNLVPCGENDWRVITIVEGEQIFLVTSEIYMTLKSC